MQTPWTPYPMRSFWRWFVLLPFLVVLLAQSNCPCDDCDSDGYTVGDGDCNDNDPLIHPGAVESCDRVDNDCDGEADEDFAHGLYADSDGDGYGGSPISCDIGGGVNTRGDCNDSDSSVHPFASELSSTDGIDQDCGGTDAADPGVLRPSTSIQAALDSAVDGQVIWVGPGLYHEQLIDFKGKSVTLISTDGEAQTVIDAQRRGRVFYFHTGETSASRLDGFTITNGYSPNMGGGISMESSSPALTRLIVTGNAAYGGGGMYLYNSSPALTEVALTGNNAQRSGGGMYLESSSPTMTQLTVTGNTASDNGGGMYLESSSPTMTQVTVSENVVSENGGGMFLIRSSPALTQVMVSGNSASSGGGMLLSYSSPTLAQVTLTGNVAWDYGGGISLSHSSPSLTQATLSGNSASMGGGGMYLTSSSPTLTNVILAYNTGANFWCSGSGSSPVLRYCDLYVPCGPNHNLETLEPSNLEVDPGFVAWSNDGEPANDDLFLRPGSLLLDAGAEDVDLDGDTWSDGEADDPDRDPDGSRTDIGALGGPDADFSYYRDEDCDGLYDGWEEVWGLDPDVMDGGEDEDGDGLSNLEELTLGTVPTVPDSDGDGWSDGEERDSGADPLDVTSIPDGQGGATVVVLRVPGEYASIQEAIGRLRAGGRIEVAGGTYAVNLRIEQKCVELVGRDGAEETVLDGGGNGSVITAVGADLRLEGFTVRNGSAEMGGGIFLSQVTGSVSQVAVTGNAASSNGGGMYLNHSSPMLAQVNVTGNSASSNGGGIYLLSSCSALTRVTLSGNIAWNFGGGMCLSASSPGIEHATLIGNTAYSGGGMALFSSSPTLTQVTMTGNTTTNYGGGMYLESSSPPLTQVTMTGNSAYLGGGVFLFKGSNPSLLNSVVAYNSYTNVYGYHECDDYCYDADYCCSDENYPDFSYVDLYAPPGKSNYVDITPSSTTYTQEPGFLSYDAGGLPDNLHLAIDSPLIDLGDPSIFDPDDSRSDIGIYGGPGAEDWDRDGDGFYDWFWPGTIEDAPPGFEPEDYDADDSNPDEH